MDSSPFWASMWYGVIFTTQALLPLILDAAYKSDVLAAQTRNNSSKYAWFVMKWGGLAVYGPSAILWPVTYFSSQGVSDLYLKLWNFVDTAGGTLHVIVAFMLFYAQAMYLYDVELSYSVVSLEFYSYFLTIYVLFWLTSEPLLLEFN